MLKLICRTCDAVFEQFGLSYAGESKNTLHCVRTQVVWLHVKRAYIMKYEWYLWWLFWEYMATFTYTKFYGFCLFCVRNMSIQNIRDTQDNKNRKQQAVNLSFDPFSVHSSTLAISFQAISLSSTHHHFPNCMCLCVWTHMNVILLSHLLAETARHHHAAIQQRHAETPAKLRHSLTLHTGETPKGTAT